MAVRRDKTKGNKWLAEFYQNGKRVRKWFLTKGEALRFFNQNKHSAAQFADSETVSVSFDAAKPSSPPLSFFVQEWFDLHGQTLNDGAARLEKAAKISPMTENYALPGSFPKTLIDHRKKPR